MQSCLVSQLSDETLFRRLRDTVVRDRATTAEMLRLIAEADRRRLCAATRHGSTCAWCLAELHLSEDAAGKRITAARLALRFPSLFDAVADGRLHLSAVCMLAPHLTPANVADLIAAATHRSKARLELLLAERFPKPDAPAVRRPIATRSGGAAQVAGPLLANSAAAPAPVETATTNRHAPGRVLEVSMTGTEAAAVGEAQVPAAAASPAPHMRGRIRPLSPASFRLELTVDRETQELLEEVTALLGHAIPSGDPALVVKRALQEALAKLGRRKHGSASAARPERARARKLVANERYIPDRVKNAVWERDGGRCAFVDASGGRCEAKTRLEYDHVTPVAKGGRTCIENLRLLCRTHNQHQARLSFGAGFMQRKLERSRRANGLGRESKTESSAGPAG